jgi:hypothetical protein
VPFAEGVRESVRWFESRPERRTIDTRFNALCDEMVEANAAALAMARR